MSKDLSNDVHIKRKKKKTKDEEVDFENA